MRLSWHFSIRKFLLRFVPKTPPGDPSGLGREVSEGAVQHVCAAEAVGAVGHRLFLVEAVLLPGHAADILEGYVVDAVQDIEATAWFEGDVAFAFLQPEPLFAYDGAAAANGETVVMIALCATLGGVAGEVEAAAFDGEVVVVAGARP